MAERSNANAKKAQDGAPDVGTLQKRGRRRLVGAIALVLLAVIVLPMVFDPEPRPNAPLVNIRIPAEDGGTFTPREAAGARTAPAQAAPGTQAEAPPAVIVPPAPDPAAAPLPKPTEPQTPTEAPKPVEKAKPATKAPEKSFAQTQSPAPEEFMVQVGAFASPDRVKEVVALLKSARFPLSTESVATANGPVTRVKMGPFGSREAAEKASVRVQKLGHSKGLDLKPANPVAK